ncbi:hypothetical protein FB45DRAFT_786155 [Roridomyces roridus]|uniref:GST N-terminal domain-containing protein n=1 Tax=Roridomyces roridus TaxID=1738132 RepID=A0AAD7CAR2_9AGAR|nr:hypothetical protein FB45DRAFT_786155 [Roridomyces roridus]
MSKTLYVFGYSLWATAAKITIMELGYSEGEIRFKTVDLFKGENFAPAYLELNPNGTTPTLEADGKVYTSTADVISYLIQNAPRKPGREATVAIIEAIHDDEYDPNFVLLSARNQTELAKKADEIPGMYFTNRQVALEKYVADPAAATYKSFYESRIKTNGAMLAFYKHTAPPAALAAFFAKSEAHWAAVRKAVFEVFPALLPASGYIGGTYSPGEEDFHMIAYLTRIAFVLGAKSTSGDDALNAFEAAYGDPLPEKMVAYWNVWVERESWRRAYAETLH